MLIQVTGLLLMGTKKQIKMKEQFATYEIALAMKELGLHEPCFGYYRNDNKFIYLGEDTRVQKNSILAPLWQQCIDWFREKYNLHIGIKTEYDGTFIITIYNMNKPQRAIQNFYQYNTYSEAREQVVLKAIELCKDILK